MPDLRYAPSTEVRMTPTAGGSFVLVGYAARYYDPNDPGTVYVLDSRPGKVILERIRQGAFDKSLSGDIVSTLNHDANIVLGRTTAGTLRIRSDAKGLAYEINPPQSAAGVVESIRRGDHAYLSRHSGRHTITFATNGPSRNRHHERPHQNTDRHTVHDLRLGTGPV